MPVFPRVLSRLLLYPLLALPTTLLAQQNTLTGTVVEVGSDQPIPFATVEIPTRQVGVQATETGTFSLTLPANLAATDSLRVASLGFAMRMLAVPRASPSRLELWALPVPLAEVMVRASTKPLVRLGPGEKGEKLGFGMGHVAPTGSNGWQVARQFLGGPAGTIQAVRFYVRPNSNCGSKSVRAPFRVRLYAADGPNGSPGTDLLTSSLLTTATKKGWHEVDLTKFQISAPASGFFVAMEWLFTDPNLGCEYTATMMPSNEKKVAYSYGQMLGGYLDESPDQTWSWSLRGGDVWRQFIGRPSLVGLPKPHNKAGHRNAAIQAIIQPH